MLFGLPAARSLALRGETSAADWWNLYGGDDAGDGADDVGGDGSGGEVAKKHGDGASGSGAHGGAHHRSGDRETNLLYSSEID